MTSSSPSNQPVFPIQSFNKLSWAIGVPVDELKRVAKSAESLYQPFINKKNREIDNPQGELKEIQARLNDRVLGRYAFPDFMTGGIKGKKIQDHLNIHVGQPVVVTLDIKKCFPSITNNMVYAVWTKKLGAFPDVARLATRLTTYKGHLPLGAPTSNLLAALVLLPSLEKASALAAKNGFNMTQFVDDMALSGEKLGNDLITEICKEFSRQGLRVKRPKVLVMRSNKPQVVTKMLVNKKMGRSRVERLKIRAALRQLELMDRAAPDFKTACLKVRGRLNFIKPFHSKEAEKMIERLNKVCL